MRTKRLGLLFVLFLIFVILYGYTLKADYIEEQKPNDLTANQDKEIEDVISSRTDEVPREEEPISVFVHSPLPDEIIERITGKSYLENDIIGIEDLSYIQVSYWGFNDEEHIGELIVNKEVALDILEIFKELFDARFPIEKIRLIDEYGADDELSMSDNNTSAFCYREIAGSKGKLSNHGYGRAIDINPIQNPYIKGDILLPKEGRDYLDRDNIRKGMIVEGDVCYNAFKARGWTWGGEWNSLKDYQHFEFNISDD